MDPAAPAPVRMLELLRYVDGDLGDEATYKAMSDEIGTGEHVLFYLEVPPLLFGRIAQGIATANRSRGARVMVEKPFGTDLASSRKLNDTMHQYFPEEAIFRVDDWLAFAPLENVLAAPPSGSGLASWRDAKPQVVAALSPLTPEYTVRGQYDGYRQVNGVDPHSTVESYVAVRLSADSWRWAGVPI